MCLSMGPRLSWIIILFIMLVSSFLPPFYLPFSVSLCTYTFPSDYELGRLLACQGKVDEAKHEFELVLSGKYLEVGASGRKGKYSLEVRSSLLLAGVLRCG
jgi:hypothetical protein